MSALLYLQDRQVGERYGISRTAIWRWLKTDPSFPKPISLSPGCSRWRVDDLERWEQAKANHAA
jgi:prophage regulatory protein